MLQEGGCPAGVKSPVVVGQVGGVADPQGNPRAKAGSAPPCLRDHRLAGVQPRYLGAIWHEARHLGHVPAGTAPDIQGGACPPQHKLFHQGILGRPQPGNGVGCVKKPDQAARIGRGVHGAELCGTSRVIFRNHVPVASQLPGIRSRAASLVAAHGRRGLAEAGETVGECGPPAPPIRVCETADRECCIGHFGSIAHPRADGHPVTAGVFCRGLQ